MIFIAICGLDIQIYSWLAHGLLKQPWEQTLRADKAGCDFGFGPNIGIE